jgi:hypothetical protein
MSATPDYAAVADLAGQVSGSVLGPADAGYDAARAVHNGLVDRRPALIVRCRTTNDVAAALACEQLDRLHTDALERWEAVGRGSHELTLAAELHELELGRANARAAAVAHAHRP